MSSDLHIYAIVHARHAIPPQHNATLIAIFLIEELRGLTFDRVGQGLTSGTWVPTLVTAPARFIVVPTANFYAEICTGST